MGFDLDISDKMNEFCKDIVNYYAKTREENCKLIRDQHKDIDPKECNLYHKYDIRDKDAWWLSYKGQILGEWYEWKEWKFLKFQCKST